MLLGARQDITTAATAQTNRLRALLLAGDDTDRRCARTTLTANTLAGLARRRLPPPTPAASMPSAGRDPAPRARCARRSPATDAQPRAKLQAIVDDIVPGLTDRYGAGPVSAAQTVVSFSHSGRCRKRRRVRSTGVTPAQSRPAAARPSGTGSIGAATQPKPGHPHHYPSPACAAAHEPRRHNPGSAGHALDHADSRRWKNSR